MYRWSHPARDRALVTAIAAIPTIVTLVFEWIGVWKPSNMIRALAGAPLGFTVATIVITALRHGQRLQQPTLHYE